MVSFQRGYDCLFGIISFRTRNRVAFQEMKFSVKDNGGGSQGSLNWDLEDGSGWIHGKEEEWGCTGWEGELSCSHIARSQGWLEKG